MKQFVSEALLIAMACLGIVLGRAWMQAQTAPATQPNAVEQPKRKPLLPWRRPVEASVGGHTAPDGTPIELDYPNERHLKNVGGSDGAGLCVFTSLSHSFDWAGYPPLDKFRDWMRKYPGGGYPQKVDSMIKKCCSESNVPVPPYVQIEDRDYSVLKTACKNGYMPAISYSHSPTGRYNGKRIYHMVTVLHADGKNYGILDNNYPGTIEWLNDKEFASVYDGWCVIPLLPGIPPIPKNKGEK